MKRKDKKSTQPEPILKQAVFYGRVSSKEQEEEGFSIPAQKRAAAEYASKHGLEVAAEFIDVETAKKAGRTQFNEMLKFLKKNPRIRTVVVEKTDRLYRNFSDYVTIDGLGLTIHFYRENVVLTPESNSHEKFIHGIKVLMAKNYLDNLSEEVKKGMTEKARQGLYPSHAPLGYLNDRITKTLVVDPERAPLVRKLFELYAHDKYSMRDLHRYGLEHGLTYPPPYSGRPVAMCTIARMLRNPIYAGRFQWKGKVYESRHERLISEDLFNIVQAKLAGRVLGSPKARTFPYVGLVLCGHCGCMVTAEIKKERYVYYHCTGFKGKCPEKYIREEQLEEKLNKIVKGIHMPEAILDWLIEALQESHADELRFHQDALVPLKAQEQRLELRLNRLYEDKLDEKITEAFWETKHQEYQAELERVRLLIHAHQQAEAKNLEIGIRTLELARTLYPRYSEQSSEEKRKLLDFVVSNCTLKEGELTPVYRQPFDLIAFAAHETKKREGLDLSDQDLLEFRRA